MDPSYLIEFQQSLEKIGPIHKYKGSKRDEKHKLIQPNNSFYNNGFNSAEYYMNLALTNQHLRPQQNNPQ